MSARFLALVCLCVFGLSVGRSEPVVSTDRSLVVYLRTAPDQPPAAVDFMKRELHVLMEEAGYRIEFRTPSEVPAEGHDAAIAVVELNGKCDLSPSSSAKPMDRRVSLASTPVIDGRVLPFSRVHCAVVDQFVAPVLALRPLFERDFLYGRALGRLVAHELYHVLANEQGHDTEGVSKPVFTAGDLLAERFDFQHAAIRKFRAQMTDSEKAQLSAHSQQLDESSLDSK
jgi:hypothetical protein